MDTQSRLDQVRRATADAIEKYHARQSQFSAATEKPEHGDVFLFPGAAAFDLSWVVIAGPSENGLLFCVPADSHPLAGLTDIVISESSAYGPLVLRCGHGLWIHPGDFASARRIAKVEERYVQRATRKLAQIAAGELKGTAAQWEAEANPDYEDWLAEIERAVDALASALRTENEDLSASDFVPVIRRSTFPADETDAPLSLAAKTGDEILDVTPASMQPEKTISERRIDFLYPGELTLQLETDGVAIIYQAAASAIPPATFVADSSGNWQPTTWISTPGRSAARTYAPWVGQQVRIRFGDGELSREVKVARP